MKESVVGENCRLPQHSDLFVAPAAASPVLHVHREERVSSGATISEVSYDAFDGGRIDALIGQPAMDVRGPRGVVIAHGGFEGGKHLFRDQLLTMASAGFVTLAADTTFPRSGDRAAVEGAVRGRILTHLRSLDVLESSFGVRSFGFFGHSGGASGGAILTAIEPRLKAVTLAGMGSASAERRAEAASHTSAAEYFDAIFSFDAALYVAVAAPRHLLVQHGRHDTAVTLAEARAMFDAAAPPKTWREYDCGHDVATYAAALADRMSFFAAQL